MAGHRGDTGGRFSDDFQPKNQKVSADFPLLDWTHIMTDTFDQYFSWH